MEDQPQTPPLEEVPAIEATAPKKEVQAITPTTWEGWTRVQVGNAIISTKHGYIPKGK